MDSIKDLPASDRPREKLQMQGAGLLSDQELLAILLGSGTSQIPLHRICEGLLAEHTLADLSRLDLTALCRFRGVGPAKATILLAASEFCRRVRERTYILKNVQSYYEFLRPMLVPQSQLQYLLLLVSGHEELLAFSELGAVLPETSRLTALAIEAGAVRILLARNGWPAFSNAEGRFLLQLRTACAALGLHCEGLMVVGPERFKMI